MSLLHPAAATVSSLAFCALLGCESKAERQTSTSATNSAEVATPALRPREPSAPAPNPSDPAPSDPAPTSASSKVSAPEYPNGEIDPVPGPRQRVSGNDGAPSENCIHGWTAPGRGSPLRKAALDMMRERSNERFVVVDIRYFRGPEDAEVIGPQREVERWYIKGYSATRHGRRQRWLVRRAEVGSGVDAVAPYDSTGYGPGIWRRPDAVDESLTDPFQRPCEGAGAGEKCMGLPRQVLGCLQGT